jgi:pilus assembly protein Flp/PilA
MRRLFRNKSGATAVEYGLLLMLGALVIITAASQMGQKTADSFDKVAVAFD